jgi:Tol biopolymer transport system component
LPGIARVVSRRIVAPDDRGISAQAPPLERVAMSLKSDQLFTLSLPAALLILGAASAQSPTTLRISVATGGVEGDADSNVPVFAANGRFVAFYSVASNLVAGDTNATTDVFVRDLRNGTTERVSVSSGGTEANGTSNWQSISADGRYVVFYSEASNLVAGDTNGVADIFVRDRALGTTERVSVAGTGAQANAACGACSITDDGRFVAFESYASNLAPGDTNGRRDIFERDRVSGTTERVSVSTTGVQGNSDSYCGPFAITADGRFVAFLSISTTLVVGDTNLASDVFLHDRVNGTTERVSVAPNGAQGNNWSSHPPVISADGRFMAFDCLASNLVSGDTNSDYDVFVRDLTTATTERVSLDSAGVEGNSRSFYPSISADCRFIAFESYATNLVAGDTNGVCFGCGVDIFVRDRQLGTTERVSVNSSGAQASSASGSSSITGDGRYVVFASVAWDLIANDTNWVCDDFVRDRGLLPPTVYCTAGISSHGCSASIAVNANPSRSLASACYLTITSVEGSKSGMLFYGIDNAGFSPSPWTSNGTSWLCVKQPTQRTAVQNSGGTLGACDGSFALDWNAYQSAHPLALGKPWHVGDKVYVQAWFRDPLAVKATNLSNALELTYQP